MDAPYLTPDGEGRAELEVKGSRFLGYAAPADSVEAADAFIARVRAEHADATHNVPAYRVRGSPPKEASSDDGEPGGSAGRPVLNVLQQRDVLDVVVVVTRYYGGVKLGVGGLVRAYGKCASLALDAAGLVERAPTERLELTVGYDDWGAVRAVLEGAGVQYEAEYGARVQVAARVPATDAAGVRDRIRSATSGRVSPTG